MVKLKAFTILEVVTAMLITVFTLGIAMGIYLNLIETETADEHIKANLLAKQYLVETEKQSSFVDDKKEIDGFLLEKSIHAFPMNEDLLITKIIVLDVESERKMAEVVEVLAP